MRGAWIVWAFVVGAVVLTGLVALVSATAARDVLARRKLLRALSTKVRDVMSHPAVVAREGTPVEEAAQIMLDRRIGCLPVVDDSGRLAGMVTRSDLTGVRRGQGPGGPDLALRIRAEGADQAYRDVQGRTVGELMTRKVVTATEDEPVSDVVGRMMNRDLHHVPVVEEGVPVGVIARHDLLGLLARDAGSVAGKEGEPRA